MQSARLKFKLIIPFALFMRSAHGMLASSECKILILFYMKRRILSMIKFILSPILTLSAKR